MLHWRLLITSGLYGGLYGGSYGRDITFYSVACECIRGPTSVASKRQIMPDVQQPSSEWTGAPQYARGIDPTRFISQE